MSVAAFVAACRCRGAAGHVLAELLDLLDLAGQLGGERLLQRLQLASLAVQRERTASVGRGAYLGLAGVGAGANEPHGGGGAESALAQTECGGHCW